MCIAALVSSGQHLLTVNRIKSLLRNFHATWPKAPEVLVAPECRKQNLPVPRTRPLPMSRCTLYWILEFGEETRQMSLCTYTPYP